MLRRMIGKLAVLVLAGALLGVSCSGCATSNTSSRESPASPPAAASPSAYARPGKSLADYEKYGSRLAIGADGQNISDDVRASIGFSPATIGDAAGRAFEGAVLLDRLAQDGRTIAVASRPLFIFYEGFRFEQWPSESEAVARSGVASADTSSATGFATGRWATVHGQPAFGEEASSPQAKVYIPESTLLWSEGRMVYALHGQGVGVEELTKIAESISVKR